MKMPKEFCYPTRKLRKENLKISILLSFFFFFLLLSSSSFFFFSITFYSKTIRHIWTFYTLNESSTTEEVPFSWLKLNASHKRWAITQNMHHSRNPRRHFGAYFTHNLQTIGRIPAFYIPNESSTTGDILFRLSNCMRASTGQLRFQMCIIDPFLLRLLHFKLKNVWSFGRILAFYIPNKFSTIADIPFWL